MSKHRPRTRTSRVLLAATTLVSSAFAAGCDDGTVNCNDPNLGSSVIGCGDMKIVDLQDDAPFGNLATPDLISD